MQKIEENDQAPNLRSTQSFNMEEDDIQHIRECQQKFNEYIENVIGKENYKQTIDLSKFDEYQFKTETNKLEFQEIESFYSKLLLKQTQPKVPRKNWSDEEITLLIYLAGITAIKFDFSPDEIPDEYWDQINNLIPYKKQDNCKFKWMQMKKTTLQTMPWSTEEDNLLLKIIQDQLEVTGTQNKWNGIAKELYSQSNNKFLRKGKQCRERWNNYLDPNMKRGSWTDIEDLELLELTQQIGCRWSTVAKKLKDRTENAVKNRYKSLIKKFNKQRIKIQQQQYEKKLKQQKKSNMCKIENDDQNGIETEQIQSTNHMETKKKLKSLLNKEKETDTIGLIIDQLRQVILNGGQGNHQSQQSSLHKIDQQKQLQYQQQQIPSIQPNPLLNQQNSLQTLNIKNIKNENQLGMQQNNYLQKDSNNNANNIRELLSQQQLENKQIDYSQQLIDTPMINSFKQNQELNKNGQQNYLLNFSLQNQQQMTQQQYQFPSLVLENQTNNQLNSVSELNSPVKPYAMSFNQAQQKKDDKNQPKNQISLANQNINSNNQLNTASNNNLDFQKYQLNQQNQQQQQDIYDHLNPNKQLFTPIQGPPQSPFMQAMPSPLLLPQNFNLQTPVLQSQQPNQANSNSQSQQNPNSPQFQGLNGQQQQQLQRIQQQQQLLQQQQIQFNKSQQQIQQQNASQNVLAVDMTPPLKPQTSNQTQQQQQATPELVPFQLEQQQNNNNQNQMASPQFNSNISINNNNNLQYISNNNLELAKNQFQNSVTSFPYSQQDIDQVKNNQNKYLNLQKLGQYNIDNVKTEPNTQNDIQFTQFQQNQTNGNQQNQSQQYQTPMTPQQQSLIFPQTPYQFNQIPLTPGGEFNQKTLNQIQMTPFEYQNPYPSQGISPLMLGQKGNLGNNEEELENFNLNESEQNKQLQYQNAQQRNQMQQIPFFGQNYQNLVQQQYQQNKQQQQINQQNIQQLNGSKQLNSNSNNGNNNNNTTTLQQDFSSYSLIQQEQKSSINNNNSNTDNTNVQIKQQSNGPTLSIFQKLQQKRKLTSGNINNKENKSNINTTTNIQNNQQQQQQQQQQC